MLTKQQQIAEHARRHPERCFISLNHHLTKDLLKGAYHATNQQGAAGIDGQTAKNYAAELETNLADLLERAKRGRYRAPAVKRVYIPKADGTQRPLGIPTFEDRVLQRAVLMLVEPIYEQDFLDGSYGYRPKRTCHDALQTLYTQLQAQPYVLELDIQSYFNTLDKSVLRQIVRQRIGDGVICRLLDKWLKAGVMEGGHLHYPETGTPQGGVISPLLANLYLHEVLDKWLDQTVKAKLTGRLTWVRYADDAVICFQNERDAKRVLEVLPKRFARYGLQLHPKKTRLLHFIPRQRNTFNFLGFTHYWGKSRKGRASIKRKTAKDRYRRAIQSIAQWCRAHRHLPIPKQHTVLRRMLLGHDAYYGITGNYRSLARLRNVVQRVWVKWLRRRSQKGRFNWTVANRMFKRYPLPAARVVHSYAQRTFSF